MQRVITMGGMGAWGQAGPASEAESYIPTESEQSPSAGPPATQAPATLPPASAAPASAGGYPVTASFSPTSYLPSLGGSMQMSDILMFAGAAFILGFALVKYRSQF